MKKILKRRNMLKLCLCLSGVILQNNSYAAEAERVEEKRFGETKYGRPIFDIRYLHESVNQKGIVNQGNANTVRTRIGYETAKFYDLSALVEVGNTKSIGAMNYNDSVNSRTQYPTTPDPEQTNLNRLYVDYSGIEKTNVRLGRQYIDFNNQRFIGSVAWRQTAQTMDGVLIKTKLIKDTEISYAHVNRVNRVFTNRSKVGTWNDDNINLINASYNPIQDIKITGYSYLLDIPDNTQLSNATYGSRVESKKKINDHIKAGLNLEYAYQRGYAKNTNKSVFNYFLIEPSLTYDQWTVSGMFESIAGNGSSAMQFSLGTNHAFNGWVDKFLTTPVNGLVDSNVTLQHVFKSDNKFIDGAKALIRYHKFRAQNANPIMDYGSEVDFFLEKSFKNNLTIGLQSGRYKAKGLYTNTSKVMPYVSYKF